MSDPHAILVYAVIASDPDGLLRPGAPVYSVRDALSGWTVEGADGSTLVHAPTEGDGDTHSLEAGVWALRLWMDGALVREGWDRARAVLNTLAPRYRDLGDTITAADCIRVAQMLAQRGCARIVRLDRAGTCDAERAP